MFNGKLVNLRALRESNLPIATEYLNNIELMSMLDDDIIFPMNIERQKEWYEKNKTYSDPKKGASFSIETKDGLYIGECGTHHVDFKNRNTSVGIYIGHEDYLGKGYGTEAMMLLLEFLFCEMNMHKAYLSVFAFNTRAIKSYEKCGFILEAIAKQGLYRNAKYHDLVMMAVLKLEFLQNR